MALSWGALKKLNDHTHLSLELVEIAVLRSPIKAYGIEASDF